MENSVVVHGQRFVEGDTYYSVGALQVKGIEQWEFTGDRFDTNRVLMKNMFKTPEEAHELLKYIQGLELESTQSELKYCPNGCESEIERTYSDLLNPKQYGYRCGKCGKEFYIKRKI